MSKVSIQDVKFVESVYPRSKPKQDTIDRYVDAFKAGLADEFPPIVLEKETNILLDGKHRLEAHKRWLKEYQEWNAKDPEKRKPKEWEGPIPDGQIKAEHRTIPKGQLLDLADSLDAEAEEMEASEDDDAKTKRDEAQRARDLHWKRFAATFSCKHGLDIDTGSVKQWTIESFQMDPTLNVNEWARSLSKSQSTVWGWVGHLVNKKREQRRATALRLTLLGWTQREIAEALEVKQPTIHEDLISFTGSGNFYQDEAHTYTRQAPEMRDKGVERHDIAERLNIPVQLVWALELNAMETDEERVKALDIKTQPYDVWNFSACHDLMGADHPGRIPGQLVCNLLYFFTQPGDVVLDPMAGSGTTLDACLLMGRKCFGYDIDQRHKRVDVIPNNLDAGWPDKVGKADLVFWDPPYFDKMDKGTIGSDGYIDGSVSGLDPETYKAWFADQFTQLKDNAKQGARLAFLMSDWDPENAKNHADHPGIFVWDYADILRQAGWTLRRQIQCPLGTQQVHPDIVNKFREQRRLARLGRYMIIAEA